MVLTAIGKVAKHLAPGINGREIQTPTLACDVVE
jgi:hypothetical protein